MRHLALVAIVLAAPLLAADAAMACSCVSPKPREQLRDADAAFIGRLVEVREVNPPAEGEPIGTGDPVDYVYRVGRIYKDPAGRLHRGGRVRVRSVRGEATCGLPNRPGALRGPVRTAPSRPLARQPLPLDDRAQDAPRTRLR